MKFSGVRYLTEQGIENIWKNRLMAFASFCVLLISLLLVGVSVLAYQNISSMVGGMAAQNEIMVYLEETVTEEETEAVRNAIHAMPNIAEVEFYSKEEAYEDLKDRMPDYDELFASLGEESPLVDSYRVQIQEIAQLEKSVSQLKALPHVESVTAPDEFVSVLLQLRLILSCVMGALILAMIIVSLVIISNTTRTSVYARREEIRIMRYVGATNAFIRLPFFIEGMVTGFFAGCGALVITWVVYDAVLDVLARQVDFMHVIGVGSVIAFREVCLPVALAYLLGGAFIGAVGSACSTRKYMDA